MGDVWFLLHGVFLLHGRHVTAEREMRRETMHIGRHVFIAWETCCMGDMLHGRHVAWETCCMGDVARETLDGRHVAWETCGFYCMVRFYCMGDM